MHYPPYARFENLRKLHRLRFVAGRMFFVLCILGLVGGFILFNFFYLQLTHHKHYSMLSNDNRINIFPIQPRRGNIYDRTAIPLADSRPIYGISINPNEVTDPQWIIDQISPFVPISKQEKKGFLREINIQGQRREILLKEVMPEDIAPLAMHLYRLKGVMITADTIRNYIYDDVFAHITGHIGEIDADDLASLDRRNYLGSRYIGKIGIEKYYESDLRGSLGEEYLEINARGSPIRTLYTQPSKQGKDLMLTVDFRMQQAAHNLLSGYEGAVVVIDTRSGDILVLASRPSFNPNAFLLYRFGEASPHSPPNLTSFFNRATSGRYSPGSTVKPLIALSALKAKSFSTKEKYFAGPFYTIPDTKKRYRDWRKWGHGWLNMQKAITQSSDVFFYEVARRTGIHNIANIYKDFGFGSPTGIDFHEDKGLVPTPEWKKATKHEPWYLGETLIVGIGQGYLLATPLQMAYGMLVFASKGKGIKPRLLRATRDNSTHDWNYKKPEAKRELTKFSEEYWQYITKGMVDSIYKPNGTAFSTKFPKIYKVAGKTGTVQVRTFDESEERDSRKLPKRHRDHAMFVGFAPFDEPEIAFAVVVEHSGTGGRIASPMMKNLLSVYFDFVRDEESLEATSLIQNKDKNLPSPGKKAALIKKPL